MYSMKKIFSILSAGLVALAAVSCVQEKMTVFDPAKATAPVLASYEVTDAGITADFAPGSFGQSFNTHMPVNHSLVIVSVNGANANKMVSATIKDNIATASANNISKALMALGCEVDSYASFDMVIRASMQEVSKDNGRNGHVDSEGKISVTDFHVVEQKGSPYQDYTELSNWTVIGSLAAYEMSWDKDLVMWTDGEGNHVAAHVTLTADDEFKFRQDQDWAVNMGGEFGGLDSDFSVTQDGANIKVGADGVYDLFFSESGMAWIAPAYDPYPDYTEASNWSVIGALSNYGISWDGDIAMITDGTSHVALGVNIAADDEFKFRQDKDWAVNMGGEFAGVDTEFAVTQDGPNVKVGADGVFDLFVNPDAGTALVAKASGAKVSYIAGGDEPEPEPEPVVVTGWNIIGLNGDWDNDVLAKGADGIWTAYITAEKDTEFKWRKDAAWEENYGGTFAAFGEPFAAVAGGDNIPVPAGFYKVVLDLTDEAAPTITVYNDFVVWSLIGDFNGWAGDVDMVFSDGKWVAEDVQLTPGWKLRKNHGWDDNRGGAFVTLGEAFAVTAGGDNIDCGTGKFTVVYDPEAETVTVTEGTVWSLIGDFNSWGGDVDMVEKDGLWVAEGVELTGGWKLRKNHDWAENRGGAFANFGEPFEVVHNGDNISCGNGKFNVVYNPADETVTVNLSTFGWSLIGINGDWDNDVDMTEVMPGVWMSPEVEITSAGWKLRYNHDWAVNRGSNELATEGVFVKGVQNGDNIALTGKFKVVYNANNGTIGTLKWGIVGAIASIDGFNWNNDVPMNLGSDGKWYSIPVKLTTDDQIKIRMDADWAENRGGACVAVDEAFAVTNNGDNIKAPKEGTYMIVYDPSAETITLSTDFWSMIGSFNSWNADLFMMYNGAAWVAYNLGLQGEEWKIRHAADWTLSVGGAYVTAGEAFEAVSENGPNIKVTDLEVFDVIYDTTAKTIVVNK